MDLYNSREDALWVTYQTAIDVYIDGTGIDSYYPLIWLRVADPDPVTALPFNDHLVDLYPNADDMATDLSKMRNSEYSTVVVETDNNLEFIAVYSIRGAVVLESVINLARTLFVIIVLTIGLIYFNNVSNRLVLNPIERMLEKVRLIAVNPLAAASDQVEMAGALSMMAKM